MSEGCPYAILGIPVSSSLEQARKAHHRLVLQCHPDKGGDNVMFMKVDRAYKRIAEKSEKTTHNDSSNPTRWSTDDVDNVLNMIGSLIGSFARSKIRPSKKNPAVFTDIEVDIADIYKGNTIDHTVRIKVVCPECNGEASSHGPAPDCTRCGGLGVLSGNLMCSECVGSGRVPKADNVCSRCLGTCTEEVLHVLHVCVPYNVLSEGEPVILIPDQGGLSCSPRLSPADVSIRVRARPGVLTVKGGKNIHLSTSITLVQALCGAVIPLPHPCGSPIRLKIPCGRVVNDGETISIKGKGMALDAMGETHGDMLVTFKVVFPKQLTHPEVVRLATAFGYDHERESLHFHTHLCP